MTKLKNSTEKIKPGKASFEGRYLLSALVQDEKALEGIAKLVEATEAKVLKSESLGKKTLTFAINKHKELILVSVFFEGTAQQVNNLEKTLKHEEEIERFILTKWHAEIPVSPAERQERAPRAKVERD